MTKKNISKFVAAIIILGAVFTAPIIFLIIKGDEVVEYFDLNGDGVEETVIFKDTSLSVYSKDKKIWQSESEWQVQGFYVGDLNRDDHIDISLFLFKKGSYGKDKPLWVKENDEDIKSHLFVYQLKGEEFKAVWHSSALDKPICFGEGKDTDSDGKEELVVFEGDYSRSNPCERYVSKALLKYDEFKFVLISREYL